MQHPPGVTPVTVPWNEDGSQPSNQDLLEFEEERGLYPGDWAVTVLWADVDDAAVPVGLAITSAPMRPDGSPAMARTGLKRVDARALRRLPVGRVVEVSRRKLFSGRLLQAGVLASQARGWSDEDAAAVEREVAALTAGGQTHRADRLQRWAAAKAREREQPAAPHDARHTAPKVDELLKQAEAAAKPHVPVRTGRPRRKDDAHYREVARVYAEAVGTGDRRPTQAVRRHFEAVEGFATQDMARTWVRDARRRGLLPPTHTTRP